MIYKINNVYLQSYILDVTKSVVNDHNNHKRTEL